MRKIIRIIFIISFSMYSYFTTNALYFNDDLDYQRQDTTYLDYLDTTGRITCKELDTIKLEMDKAFYYYELSYDCNEYGRAYKFYLKGKEIPGTIFADYVMYGTSWGGFMSSDYDICRSINNKESGLFKKYDIVGKNNNFTFDCTKLYLYGGYDEVDEYQKLSKQKNKILSESEFIKEKSTPDFLRFYENGVEVEAIYWGAKIDDIYKKSFKTQDYIKDEISKNVFKYSNKLNNIDYVIKNSNNTSFFSEIFFNNELYLIEGALGQVSFSDKGILVIAKGSRVEGKDNFILFVNGKIIYKGDDGIIEDIIKKDYSDYVSISNKDLSKVSLKDYNELLNKSKEINTIGKSLSDDYKNNSNSNNLDKNQENQNQINTKSKSLYIKQKLISSAELKKKKQEKIIKQIDLVVEKADKKKLEEIFNKIQKIKSDNQVIKYMESSIYLQINKTN